MLKKIKENVYVQKFLELWGNPRYRSLVILGLYLIFFVFVIGYIRTLKNENEPVKIIDVMSEYKNMDNYQYKATIKNIDNKVLIGRVNKNNQVLVYNNTNYYVTNNKIYIKEDKYQEFEENLFEFDIWKFNPNFISNLIEKGELNSTTEFKDRITAKSYVIKLTDFIKLYYGEDTTDSEDTTINITIFKSNKQVIKVELDISSMYHMGQYANSADYKVVFEYEFINQIAPIVIEIEE